MPKATAIWLIDNTTLTFKQIADFCGMHELEVKGIADGEVAVGVIADNPITSGQLDKEEIERCCKDPNAKLQLKLSNAYETVSKAKKKGAKMVHCICLMLASLALFTFPHIADKYLVFIPLIGFGIAWASMMGVPYIIVASGIPPARYGVYMGIVNMMIVIPMILQNLSFGFLYQHVLGSEPGNAILFAAALLLLAAMATLRIKTAPQTT